MPRPKQPATLELLEIRFFNPLDPKNADIGEAERQRIYHDEELTVIRHLTTNIKSLVRRYEGMTKHACGGEKNDVEREIEMLCIHFFHLWRDNAIMEESLDEKTGLDAVKFVSWRISRKIVDIARYQRDKIEPGRWQFVDETNINENEYGKSAGSTEEISNEYRQTEWYNSLTDLQKALLALWKENRFYAASEHQQGKKKGHLTDRQVYAMQVVPLIKKAKAKLRVPKSAIVGALRSLPRF